MNVHTWHCMFQEEFYTLVVLPFAICSVMSDLQMPIFISPPPFVYTYSPPYAAIHLY